MLATITQTLGYILAVLTLIVLFTVPLNSSTDTLHQVYKEVGQEQDIDPALLQAIAQVESSEIPDNVNLSDPSFGLMQILCTPNDQGVCTNRFPSVDDWEGTTVDDLFNPKTNVSIGAQILKWNLEQYGYPKGLAVYNSWSARKDPDDGPYRNQEYVDKVLDNLRRLRDEQ